MERWAGKIAVVTGASAGIGLEISKALVENGMIVVGFARRKQKMENEMKKAAVTKGKFYGVKCDISEENSVAAAFEWIKSNLGPVQVLINNAGAAVRGGFTETTPSDWQKVVNVNLMGTMYCATTAVKIMQEAKLEGHVININSIQGQRIFIFNDCNLNAYPPSKFGMAGFTEGLRRELIGHNIRVTGVYPGLVTTEMADTVYVAKNPQLPTIQSKDVADSIVYILGAPHRVEITELTIKPLGETAF